MVYIKSDPNQTLLLPTNLRDIIAKDHICFLIEEVVNQVDFEDFDQKVEGKRRKFRGIYKKIFFIEQFIIF